MAASLCRRSILNYKHFLYQIQKRTGYIILIPETPEEVGDCNVISHQNLPDFAALTPNICKQIFNKCAQSYDVGAWELDRHLQKKLKNSEDIDVIKSIIEPLEVLSVPFLSSWGIIKTLYVADQNQMPARTFVPLSERILQIVSNKYNINSFYTACKKQLAEKGDQCSEEEKRILQKFVWEGFHNGFELNAENKHALLNNFNIIKNKQLMYENKLGIAKTLFKQLITEDQFAKDCPYDLLRLTATNKQDPFKGPWVITLRDSVYWRFLEYCESRDARRHIWISYNQICSKLGDPRVNATQDVEQIRRHRRIFAQILGFPTFVHLSMKTKMAGSIENVQSVLSELLEPAKCAQEKEIYDLERFAYKESFTGTLELWDLSYWKRIYLKKALELDEMALQEYFPLSQVLLGLFALCEQLFGIVIEEHADVDSWDPDVRYYTILDAKSKVTLGSFFLDPYAREYKASTDDSGWFLTIRPRSKMCASLPLSSLVFNFMPPTEDKPSLLYFNEVKNLFGKFGEMLQYTLNQMNYSEVSGVSNIEWDAVKISSEFLQFWLTESLTLESISGHYDSGDPLPSHILDNLRNVHKHMAGTELCRKIYFSNLDLELHLQDDACLPIVDKLWSEHLLFQKINLDHHPYGFKDIFIQPWAASYYSHVWAKMVAADVFSAFEEVGFNNQEEVLALGKRYRSTFLALGGGCDPGEIFRRFRGRDPTPKSLINLLDLQKSISPPEVAPEPVLA